MNTIRFVTESHTFGDDYGEASLLTQEDVERIVAKSLEREIQRTDRMFQKLRDIVSEAKNRADESLRTAAEFVQTANESFASAIDEVLKPQYAVLESALRSQPSSSTDSNGHKRARMVVPRNLDDRLKDYLEALQARLADTMSQMENLQALQNQTAQVLSALAALHPRFQKALDEQRPRKSWLRRLFTYSR